MPGTSTFGGQEVGTRSFSVPLQIAASLAGGGLLDLSFRAPWAWPVACIATVPWLVLASRPGARALPTVAVVATGQFFQLVVSGAWLASQFGVVACVVTWTWVALLMLPVPVLWWWMAQRTSWPALLWAPVTYTAVEWLRSVSPVGRPGVYLVGHAFGGAGWMRQSAELWGVPGLTFLAVLCAAAVVTAARAELSFRRGRGKRRRAVRALAIACVALLACAAHGAWRRPHVVLEAGPRVALVQPQSLHLPHLRLHQRTAVAQHVNLTLEAVPPGSADLVAWPENVILDTLDGQPTYAEGIRVALEHVRCDLLLSAFAVAEGGRGTHASVFHLAPDGRVRARHDKLLLLPGTEYVPFESALRRVSPRAAEAWAGLVARIVGVRADGVPGREMQVFTLATSSGTTRFGAPTCYENTSAALVRSCARSGARFLVNVTSEGRVGASASEHVLRIAQLRAVETRSSVLRAGNVGITAFIDPLGDVQSVLREPRGVLADRVALGSGGPTPYTRAGDWLAMLCCLATLPLVFIRRTSA